MLHIWWLQADQLTEEQIAGECYIYIELLIWSIKLWLFGILDIDCTVWRHPKNLPLVNWSTASRHYMLYPQQLGHVYIQISCNCGVMVFCCLTVVPWYSSFLMSASSCTALRKHSLAVKSCSPSAQAIFGSTNPHHFQQIRNKITT